MRYGADVVDYAYLADDIARGQFRDRWEGAAELFRTPGYPFFLFLANQVTGEKEKVVLNGWDKPIGDYNRVAYLNILMGTFAAITFFVILAKFLSNRLSVFLTLAFAFEPTNLWQVMAISSDGLFLFILLLSLLCLIKFTLENRYEYGLLAVFLMSLDTLVRPSGLPLALIVLMYILILLVWSRRSLKGALIGLVAFIVLSLPILPWMARNYVETGYFTLSTLPSYAMFFNYIPYYKADSQGLNRDEFIPQNTKEMLILIGAPDGENARTIKYHPQMDGYVQDFLKENFWSYLAFHIVSAKDFLFSSNPLLSTWQLNPAIRLYSAIEPYMWAAIYLLALVGVMVSRHRFALFLVALCAVVILTAGTFSSNARYLLPILPAIFLLAGLGLERLLHVLSAAIPSLLRSIRSVSSLWTPS